MDAIPVVDEFGSLHRFNLIEGLIAGPKVLRHPKPYFPCEIMPCSLAARLNRLQKNAIAEQKSNLRGLKPSGFEDAYAGLNARSSTVLGNLSLSRSM